MIRVDVVLDLRVDDEDQATGYGADGNETIFEIRMITVEDFHVVVAGVEELLCLLERELMLSLVGKVLCFVRFDRHEREGKPTSE